MNPQAMNPQVIYGIFSLVIALLSVDYFVKHPIDVKAVKRNLSDFKKWYLSTDYMNSIAGILAVLGVVLVNWGWY